MKGQDWTAGAGGSARHSPISKQVLRYARISILAVITVAATLGVGFTLFAAHVARLATPADPPRADAIIVLTGGQARIDAAVNLLRSGKGERLLISGVNPMADREDLRLATGGEAELFNCCVDIDHAALDTIGNAEESAKWVTSHAYGRVILVTNNYHMPRSLLEMRRLIGGTELDPYPVVNTPLGNGGWMTKPEALRVILTEYAKYLAALARGVLPTEGHDAPVMNASVTVD